jgi:hypothetical protein
MRERALMLCLLLGLFSFVSGLIVSDSVLAQGTLSPAVGGHQTSIGRVVTAKGRITIEHPSAVVVQANVVGTAQAKVGDLVYQGDVIQTGPDGNVGLTLSDGTAFNLSSNGRMVLNEFVYDPSATSNVALFSLTKGSFTFVAGTVAKTGDMKVDTPAAVMGIRGTTPRVEILDNGSVRFSTLVEESKQAVNQAPDKARDSGRSRATRGQGVQKVRPRDVDGRICRGC